MRYTTRLNGNREFHPTNKVILKEDEHANLNLNNLDVNPEGDRNKEVPIQIQVQLIVLALDILQNEKGSTLKDIRKCLCVSGLIDASNDLRRAMVWALKRGFVARPPWAVKSGNYGVYVKGDGVPIHSGGGSRNNKRGKDKKKKKSRSSGKIGGSGNAVKKTNKRKGGASANTKKRQKSRSA